jgi:hypothetical protein
MFEVSITQAVMSEIGFYLTFEALLYGLIVTKLLLGWNEMISNWKDVKFYWAHTLFTIEMFFMLMIRFKGRLISDDYENIENVYQVIFHMVSVPALIYFVIHQSFGNNIKTIDMKQFVTERRLHIFIPLLVLWFISVIDIYLVKDYALELWQLTLFFILSLPLVIIKNLRYFEVLVTAFGLYACYAAFVV